MSLGSINPNNTYYITILKDGANKINLIQYDTTATIDSEYYSIDSSAFIYSDGANYIEINGNSNDNFIISNEANTNQLMIEYVAK